MNVSRKVPRDPTSLAGHNLSAIIALEVPAWTFSRTQAMTHNSVHFKKFMKVYGQSEVIFEEGQPGSEMYIVHSGKVRIYRAGEEGEVEIGIIGPGEFFGEMALVDHAPRSATACAVEDDTALVALDKNKFLFLVSHQPVFALVIMHQLCQKIRSLSEAAFATEESLPIKQEYAK
jgi:CRP-like cAMP-binding protein